MRRIALPGTPEGGRALSASRARKREAQTRLVLNERQKRFVVNYCMHGEALKAMKQAGYPEVDCTRKNSRILLRLPHVSQAVAQRRISLNGCYALTAEKTLGVVVAIAFQDISRLLDWDGTGTRLKPVDELEEMDITAIKKIKEVNTQWGTVVEVEMYDRLKAAEMLMRREGSILEPGHDPTTTARNVRIAADVLDQLEKHGEIPLELPGGIEDPTLFDDVQVDLGTMSLIDKDWRPHTVVERTTEDLPEPEPPTDI
jgi:phage terminase small subunit